MSWESVTKFAKEEHNVSNYVLIIVLIVLIFLVVLTIVGWSRSNSCTNTGERFTILTRLNNGLDVGTAFLETDQKVLIGTKIQLPQPIFYVQTMPTILMNMYNNSVPGTSYQNYEILTPVTTIPDPMNPGSVMVAVDRFNQPQYKSAIMRFDYKVYNVAYQFFVAMNNNGIYTISSTTEQTEYLSPSINKNIGNYTNLMLRLKKISIDDVYKDEDYEKRNNPGRSVSRRNYTNYLPEGRYYGQDNWNGQNMNPNLFYTKINYARDNGSIMKPNVPSIISLDYLQGTSITPMAPKYTLLNTQPDSIGYDYSIGTVTSKGTLSLVIKRMVTKKNITLDPGNYYDVTSLVTEDKDFIYFPDIINDSENIQKLTFPTNQQNLSDQNTFDQNGLSQGGIYPD